MKLYVLREYAAYGETHSEATREQIRENEIVQQLIAEALEAERDDDGAKFFDAQAPENSY